MPEIIKKREKEYQHRVLEILDKRLELAPTYKRRLWRWDKGYEAEEELDVSVTQLRSDCLAINGIYLIVDGNEYQIDSILVFSKKVVVADVKNYEGEYEVKEGRVHYVPTDYEIRNPFHQIEKNETALRQLLFKLRLDMPVEGRLIFWNPQFTLYHAPKSDKLILPSKVPDLLKEWDGAPGRINDRQRQAAKKIAAMNIIVRKNDKLPDYRYEELRKGITCKTCRSLMEKRGQRSINCPDCGYHEPMQQGLWRMAEGLDLLRVNKEFIVTANQFREYCGGLPTNHQAHSFLDKYASPIKMKKPIPYHFSDNCF